MEVDEYREWLTTPLNTLRTDPLSACSESSFEKEDRKLISCYCGYIHINRVLLKLVDQEQTIWPLSLSLYCQHNLFLHFLGALLAKRCSPAYITAHVLCAARVLAYLRITYTIGSAKQEESFEAWQNAVSNLKRQCQKLPPFKPKESISDLHQRGAWLSYVSLYKITRAIVDTFHYRFAAKYGHDATTVFNFSLYTTYTPPPRPLAQAMHDTAIVCLCVGYVPPMRPSCLISLKHPRFAWEPCCLGVKCPYGPGCQGNRLEYVYKDAAMTTER